MLRRLPAAMPECPFRLINTIMLSQNLCQVYRCLFLHSLKRNSVNVARRIHSSSKKLSDSESKEQTVQKCETEELPQNTENSKFGRLHIPVMLEEVVNCLSPQPVEEGKPAAAISKETSKGTGPAY